MVSMQLETDFRQGAEGPETILDFLVLEIGHHHFSDLGALTCMHFACSRRTRQRPPTNQATGDSLEWFSMISAAEKEFTVLETDRTASPTPNREGQSLLASSE